MGETENYGLSLADDNRGGDANDVVDFIEKYNQSMRSLDEVVSSIDGTADLNQYDQALPPYGAGFGAWQAYPTWTVLFDSSGPLDTSTWSGPAVGATTLADAIRQISGFLD